MTVKFDEIDAVTIEGELSRNTANLTESIINMSLKVDVSANLGGRIYFTVSTNEGVAVSFSYIYIDIRSRTPKLRVLPSSIDVKAVRGGVGWCVDVVLENIGSLNSDLIQVVVPEQPVLHHVPSS